MKINKVFISFLTKNTKYYNHSTRHRVRKTKHNYWFNSLVFIIIHLAISDLIFYILTIRNYINMDSFSYIWDLIISPSNAHLLFFNYFIWRVVLTCIFYVDHWYFIQGGVFEWTIELQPYIYFLVGHLHTPATGLTKEFGGFCSFQQKFAFDHFPQIIKDTANLHMKLAVPLCISYSFRRFILPKKIRSGWNSA